MKLVGCSRCGSKELVEDDGYMVCVYCQSRFVPGSADVPAVETVIGVASDIECLLVKCRSEPQNSRRYASLVLDIDPTNTEAMKYLR
jgi:hypothetical protein